MNGNNMQRFANLLSDRMKATSSATVRTTLELGRINEDKDLIPDSLMVPIPVGEYMVNLMLQGSMETSIETHSHVGGAHGGHDGGDGNHSHTDDGHHAHRLPSRFNPLKAGDRVLIAWCGTEPVVIAKVVASMA